MSFFCFRLPNNLMKKIKIINIIVFFVCFVQRDLAYFFAKATTLIVPFESPENRYRPSDETHAVRTGAS